MLILFITVKHNPVQHVATHLMNRNTWLVAIITPGFVFSMNLNHLKRFNQNYNIL